MNPKVLNSKPLTLFMVAGLQGYISFNGLTEKLEGSSDPFHPSEKSALFFSSARLGTHKKLFGLG